MASASPQPEELANMLFGALRVFTDGSLTQVAISLFCPLAIPGRTSRLVNLSLARRPQGAAAEGMERAFGLLGQVKRLPRQDKVQCIWKLSQLGAFPLVIAMLDPKSATFSLGCTTLGAAGAQLACRWWPHTDTLYSVNCAPSSLLGTGVCLEDEDLLSHRIGKTLTREPHFLEAIDTGLTPIASGRPDTAFLVAQMVNNVGAFELWKGA